MSDEDLRVIFDTSVLIAIAGRPGGNYATWKAVLDGVVIAVTCQAALDELSDVLARSPIRQHYGASLDAANVNRFVAGYRAMCRFVNSVPERFILLADPKDSIFVNLAIESGAHYLLTYDEIHLLPLDSQEHPQYAELRQMAPQLRIVKPAQLAAELLKFRQEKSG